MSLVNKPRSGEASRMLTARMKIDPVSARHDVLRALELCGGVATRAANLLGISHRAILRLLKDDVIAAGAAALRQRAKSRRAALKGQK